MAWLLLCIGCAEMHACASMLESRVHPVCACVYVVYLVYKSTWIHNLNRCRQRQESMQIDVNMPGKSIYRGYVDGDFAKDVGMSQCQM